MNYDEKIKQEFEHIPESKKEQLYQIVRTFRRQNDIDTKVEERDNTQVHDPKMEYPYTETTSDWEEITDDPYYALMKIREAMRQGNYTDAHAGVEELYKLQTLEEEELLMKAISNVMEAIILWKESDTYKTTDTVIRIHRGRDNIDLQIHEDTPVDERCMDKVWDEAFQRAKKYAEIELQRKVKLQNVSKEEVLEQDFVVKEKEAGEDYGE